MMPCMCISPQCCSAVKFTVMSSVYTSPCSLVHSVDWNIRGGGGVGAAAILVIRYPPILKILKFKLFEISIILQYFSAQ